LIDDPSIPDADGGMLPGYHRLRTLVLARLGSLACRGNQPNRNSTGSCDRPIAFLASP
jgi:hypothetical protein